MKIRSSFAKDENWYGVSKPNPFPKSIYDNVAFGQKPWNGEVKGELIILLYKVYRSLGCMTK